MSLADDFATKGSMPVHAYIWNDLDKDGKIDYWTELTDITSKITRNKSQSHAIVVLDFGKKSEM